MTFSSDFEEIQIPSIDPSLFDLFSVEIEAQCLSLTEGLLYLENNSLDKKIIESLMRAAHSIKGAAAVVNLTIIVKLAHALENYFVRLNKEQREQIQEEVDRLLQCVDIIVSFARSPPEQINHLIHDQLSTIQVMIKALNDPNDSILSSALSTTKKVAQEQIKSRRFINNKSLPRQIIKRSENKTIKAFQKIIESQRLLRITVQSMNQLMILGGELLVQSRKFSLFALELQKIKKAHFLLSDAFDSLRLNIPEVNSSGIFSEKLSNLASSIHSTYEQMIKKFNQYDDFIWSHTHLAETLYQEIISSRMRPFADALGAFPRMVRDLSQKLGKNVVLEVLGSSTLVDRDILDKLETPLSHLIRNAVDHGIESAEERAFLGKQKEGIVKLEARHVGGVLVITVSDDGRGIDCAYLRKKLIQKQILDEENASRLTDLQILDFLYLPGFSTTSELTDVSGRGMGLNIIQNIIKEVGGNISMLSNLGFGLSIHLHLPATLSVIRALVAEISGGVFAFPLGHIYRTLILNEGDTIEQKGTWYFVYEDQNIPLVSAWRILELEPPPKVLPLFYVIILNGAKGFYGLVVDLLVGERELVIRELDPCLGKIKDITAGSFNESGEPVLIIDVPEITRSIELFLNDPALKQGAVYHFSLSQLSKKRILVVEDCPFMLETECKLLEQYGYSVKTAKNGIEGWNAARTSEFDLIITDINMPYMDGIELVRVIRKDPLFTHLPILILSSIEESKGRRIGLQVGADAYLSKTKFQEILFIEMVETLIH